jgi:unsaturated chondroitin disaccharide hydrolase
VLAGDLVYGGFATYDHVTVASGSSDGVSAVLRKQITGASGTSAEEDVISGGYGPQSPSFPLASGTPSSGWAACDAVFRPQSLSLPELVANDLGYSQAHLRATLAAVPGNEYPVQTGSNGQWELVGPGDWSSGYFPGQLWLLYEATGKSFWKAQAESRQAAIASQDGDTTNMDVGLMMGTSFGNGYRLTGNLSYRNVMLTAARTLATRYTSVTGSIRSFNDSPSEPASDFQVIVDSMITLDAFWWAADQTGEGSWNQEAIQHAEQVEANQVRPDGSTYHLVVYNGDTGAVVRHGTIQGYSTDSTWSRG